VFLASATLAFMLVIIAITDSHQRQRPIATHAEDLTTEEMQRRTEDFMKNFAAR
jgi:hypothetical protein